MTNARKPEPQTKRDELDLLPHREGMKRADEVLRRMLSTPPDPQTPPQKPAKRKASK